MDDLERVTVVNAFTEFTAAFTEPAFGLGENWSQLHSAMVRALAAWGLGSRGISFRTDPNNLSEVRANYQLPDSRFVFGVGVDSAVVSISNAAWEDLPRFLSAVELGLEAVRATTNVSIASQKVTLAMHVKPQTRSSLQILQGLVQAGRLLLPGERSEDYGLTVHTDRGSYSLEPSLRFFGVLYIGFDRRYAGQKLLAEIAEDVRRTEEHVLNALGLALVIDSVPTSK